MTSGTSSYFYRWGCFSAFPLPCGASGASVKEKKDEQSQHRARNESFELKGFIEGHCAEKGQSRWEKVCVLKSLQSQPRRLISFLDLATAVSDVVGDFNSEILSIVMNAFCLSRTNSHNYNVFIVSFGGISGLLIGEIRKWLPSLQPEVTLWVLSNTSVKVKCKFEAWLTTPTLQTGTAMKQTLWCHESGIWFLSHDSSSPFFLPALTVRNALDISIHLTVKLENPGNRHSCKVWQRTLNVMTGVMLNRKRWFEVLFWFSLPFWL